MTSKQIILLQIHAKTCGLWSPVRSWSGDIGRNLYFGREQFRVAGVRFLAHGNATEKKAAERNLSYLEADGLLKVTRTKERIVHAKLTPAGEAQAVSLVGLPCLSVSLETTKSLANHPDAVGGGWTQERLWLGYGPKASPSLEEWQDAAFNALTKLWPSLCREYVESGTTGGGAVFYRIAPAGVKALEQPLPQAVEANMDFEAEDIFYREYNDERRRLNSDIGNPLGEIGSLPLSLSTK